ncbi:Golgi-specific brefeldin A-resistance guanine nucleotide exchange factor 1 [Acipenser ruthenus]|uniref:Golgi-specific brefeldin A-resistance guanine nucleotide exchange factor 1 n=1 Tax=Acipenser ruthenus TaxID=7906 RepID=A0A444UGN8_ACIRT|nr:Golgi-specific brefeldin A-resistance guanine nucleotide exchange factor 1 [Acipenser ruthenus]
MELGGTGMVQGWFSTGSVTCTGLVWYETDKAQSMVQPSVPPPPPPPASTPTRSPVEVSPAMSQSPLILQPLASPLQVGHPPMSLPIILNPALIEATSPVPLLSTPRDPNSEVK